MPPFSTSFRSWMEHFVSSRGGNPEWPWLLRELLIAEYLRQREREAVYAGEVFKDRDEDDPAAAVLAEKLAVKELYHLCRRETGGVLSIGTDQYWLLGYEWPNQASERGRRADLVGLTVSGGLVVFECKLDNKHGPFAALLEGLDYLSCLSSNLNFRKVQDGFAAWVAKPASAPPDGFAGCVPVREARHEVVVLASPEYCGRYRRSNGGRSNRGLGWTEFLALPPSTTKTLELRFAETDFKSAIAKWITE